MRLCAASKFYDVVQRSGSPSIFVKFIEETYLSVLDDTAHLVQVHGGDVRAVYTEWTQKYGFANCSISDCAKSGRHYRREREDTVVDPEADAVYDFYESLFDRVHNFVAHLFDIGLRVDAAALVSGDGGGDEKETDTVGVTVDELFAAERDHIRSMRQNASLDLDRFENENNKFVIKMSTQSSDVTFTDAMLKKLGRSGGDELKQFLSENDMDSDCIEADVEDVTDSNIGRFVQNQSVVEIISAFARSANCMRSIIENVSKLFMIICFSLFRGHSASQCILHRIHFQLLEG